MRLKINQEQKVSGTLIVHVVGVIYLSSYKSFKLTPDDV